jgi:hypothetical protein
MVETLRADFGRIPELLALPEPDQPAREEAELVVPEPEPVVPVPEPVMPEPAEPAQLGLF